MTETQKRLREEKTSDRVDPGESFLHCFHILSLGLRGRISEDVLLCLFTDLGNYKDARNLDDGCHRNNEGTPKGQVELPA